jgi:hypothetical protein
MGKILEQGVEACPDCEVTAEYQVIDISGDRSQPEG